MTQINFQRAAERLRSIPTGFKKAVWGALGRTLTHAKASISKSVRQEYNVKAARIKSSISVERQSTGLGTKGIVRVRGSNLLASNFLVRPKTDTTGSKRRLVRLGIRRGRFKNVESGFIAKGRLVQRVGARSYPLAPVFGPSVAAMAGNQDVVQNVQNSCEEMFVRRFEHEVSRLLEKNR